MFERDRIVSELRSAIEGMRLETLVEFPDARLEEDFAERSGPRS